MPNEDQVKEILAMENKDKLMLHVERFEGAKDSSFIKHALREFEILNWPGDCDMQLLLCKNLISLLATVSNQGHSGTSLPYLLHHFNALAEFKPISPLTGNDNEWNEVRKDVYQNKRCSEVFKGADGKAYWIYGKVFREKNGGTFTSGDSRVYIDFPWKKPESEIVDV